MARQLLRQGAFGIGILGNLSPQPLPHLITPDEPMAVRRE
jgi:hypothetical protein